MLVLVPSREILACEAVVVVFAVLYGFGLWSTGRTITSVAAFAVLAGAVMYPRVQAGDLPSTELVEVVTPLVLVASVVYHARRREAATLRADVLAAADRRRVRAREMLSRLTSHELRTPLTIAAGYVDHLIAGERSPTRREDLVVVREELDRITRVSERLVRTVALDLGAPDQRTDVAGLLEEVRRRWGVVVDRDLVVDCTVATVPVHAGRLLAAVDTLVENSVRYTTDGGRIRVFAHRVGDRVQVGVADDGSGLSPELVAHVNAGVDRSADVAEAPVPATPAEAGLRDLYSQTGFGLRIVASIAQAAGGRLEADRAPEGGARLTLSIPADGDPAQRTVSVTDAERTRPDPLAASTRT